MNSLRTDDIRGAMPRVRHMAKNLIRQMKYPSRYATNLQPYPLDQESQTQIVSYPSPRSSRLVNYSQLHQPSPLASSLYLPPKLQSPLKPVEKENPEHMHTRNTPQIIHYHSKHQDKLTQKTALDECRRQSSSHSLRDNTEKVQPKKFFRGLGFNIITNNKYQYIFQNSYK